MSGEEKALMESIDKYLTGSLSNVEALELEKRLEENESFYHYLLWTKKKQGIITNEENNLLSKVSNNNNIEVWEKLGRALEIEKKKKDINTTITNIRNRKSDSKVIPINSSSKSTTSNRRFLKSLGGVAASLLLFFFLYQVLTPDSGDSKDLITVETPPNDIKDEKDEDEMVFGSPAKELGEKIFSEYFSILPVNSELGFKEAFAAYHNQEFGKALTLFDKVKPQDQNYNAAQLYKSICYLTDEVNQTAQAIQVLQSLPENDMMISNDRNWYLALAYLKNKENEKAKGLLQNISSSPKHSEREKAKEILKDLNE